MSEISECVYQEDTWKAPKEVHFVPHPCPLVFTLNRENDRTSPLRQERTTA